MAVKSVSNAAELIEALKTAKDGDVLLLEPGTYSGLYLRGFQFENVTIQSKDPANKAVLTDLMVRESSGVNFSNLEFYVDPAKHIYQFQVLASNDIHFEGLHVHGSLNGSPADDKDGLFIRNSSNVSISNSEFEQLWHGIAHLDSNGLLFAGNKFHDIRTDGIRGGGSSDVTITKNLFTDFRPSAGDHPDAIQFWTTHTTASARNITITDNVMVRGDGGHYQGIFIRDNVGDLPFQNVTIANNLVLGGMYNGITVLGGEGVGITGNTVVGFTDMKSWIRVQDSDQVIVSGNTAQDFLFINSTRLVDTANQEVPAATDAGASIWQQWIDARSDDAGSGGEPALPSTPAPSTPPPATPSTPTPTPVPEPAPTPAPEARVGGTAGADRLGVVPGKKTLIDAGGGNDVLTGGVGGNILVGGKGNDTYIVSDRDDVVRELPGGGTDTVASSVNYVLGDHLEVLRLVGAARSGTGNELDNRIVGTAFADRLAGLAGDDQIQGLGGDDILLGGAGHDQLSGDDGNDKLFGEAGADKLMGGAGNDVLDGGDGDDWLEGGLGADNMTGGAGADTFIFRPSDITTSPDTITDFSSRQGDKIVLSLLDANSRTAADDKFAFIGSQGFTGVAGQLRYDVKNGGATVYGDTNGDGRADFTIVLLNVSSLSASDFVL